VPAGTFTVGRAGIGGTFAADGDVGKLSGGCVIAVVFGSAVIAVWGVGMGIVEAGGGAREGWVTLEAGTFTRGANGVPQT